MELQLENQEASLAFKILRRRANEIQREIEQNKDINEVEYLKHKGQILKDLIGKLKDIDENAHMKGYKDQEI